MSILRVRRAGPGELVLTAALGVWERQLRRESLERWSVRGAIAAFAVGSAILLVGWIAPQPEDQLRPLAFAMAVVPLLAVCVIALWPRARLRQAVLLDSRLELGDRLATAWSYREHDDPIVRLQREDAISRLDRQSALTWKLARSELIALGTAAAAFILLLVIPSPQQAVLDQQAADRVAISQASDRLDAISADALANPSLTSDQARQISELLQQMQLQLSRSQSKSDATAVLARAQQQLAQQLGDSNADLRAQAIAAMSDTLAAEPTTQALADALQSQDPRATSEAMKALEAQADSLSDVERQALSRALQRAANVGRGDAPTSSALHAAAQALNANDSAQSALSAADAALTQSVQSARAQASINTTVQRLQELQAQLASGDPLRSSAALAPGEQDTTSTGLSGGTPVALDALGQLHDPRPADTQGAGSATASLSSADPAGAIQPAENVFVPGRQSTGPSSQDLVDQPFTVRGQPRPYRDVLNEYAASSRDYVDRPDVSPAVRDLVKQYFQSLEEGQ